jgi:hypothetical protein
LTQNSDVPPEAIPEFHDNREAPKTAESRVQVRPYDIPDEKTGNIEENWPWVEDRLMEEF